MDTRSLKLMLVVAAMGIATVGAAVHGAHTIHGRMTVSPPEVVSLARQARHARRLQAWTPPVILEERTVKTPAPRKKTDLSRATRRQV